MAAAAEVRVQILALLAQEPQTPSIVRQVEFLERDLARLEAPAPVLGDELARYPFQSQWLVKLGLNSPAEQYGLYFSFGVAMAGSIRPLIKYHYLSRYLHTKEEGTKLIYAFKGGLSQIELNAGEFMLKEFPK
eukprot:CAMPEP_0201092244 /NCGR_PEP_ID=MMETSP0812-20130820/824_1 /ASSEMBLY_ACC=CAM_ASM_000668 /TAXON_ID=98059 /ORGANISM="Dinobryon sp., Strain UTEXLB2267" /LENGTH=132 /DNA_ID=CAMNT_0047343729 /DNA_START=18 /DNA_END=413 /DNA_ORIENTATION=+